MTNTFIALDSVTLTLPDGTPLFSQLNETFDARPTGLVGRNGVGKSMLSHILAGKILPSSGYCSRSGKAYYLAQQVVHQNEHTVADLAGIRAVISALERIEAGSVSGQDFELVADRWDIRQRLQLELELSGLEYLDASTPVHRLSGGEAMRVSLLGARLAATDFLILDEPSNHLDRSSRKALMAQLARWSGGLIVVSHDRELLESMQRIVELSPQGLCNYGGNYAFYAQQKAAETQNALQLLEQRKHERQQEQKKLRELSARLEKRQSRGHRQGKEANQAKILLGGQKQRSEASAGKINQRQSATRAVLDQRVRDAVKNVDDSATIVVHSQAVDLPSGRQIAELSDVQLPFVADFSPPLNLTLTARQRIGVVGNNGCGKSTLLKILAGQRQPSGGICRVFSGPSWLDQHLIGLHPRRTILEQILEANRTAGEAELRMRLAQLGLDAHKIQIPSGELSGGERLKAALACVLYANPTPELLLLDEPSNHLDLPSVKGLEIMLQTWQGALFIVSHDEVFLNNLNLTHRLSLFSGGWNLEAW